MEDATQLDRTAYTISSVHKRDRNTDRDLSTFSFCAEERRETISLWWRSLAKIALSFKLVARFYVQVMSKVCALLKPI